MDADVLQRVAYINQPGLEGQHVGPDYPEADPHIAEAMTVMVQQGKIIKHRLIFRQDRGYQFFFGTFDFRKTLPVLMPASIINSSLFPR